MKDIIYAGFAQLSYLDWQNLSESIIDKELHNNRNLKILLSRIIAFDQIKTPTYDKWNAGENYCREIQDGKRIYDAADSRIFYLYSEHYDRPDENPKYPEFGEWEFLCAYNHSQIRTELEKENRENIISLTDSGFQASAFKNGNKIIIAYRGSDDITIPEHKSSDWYITNLGLGLNKYVDQLTCTAWFYDKVCELAANADIHITGHSLGGCLAQYAFIYSGSKHSTKTWNGLGIGEVFKELRITSVFTRWYIMKKVLVELNFIKDNFFKEDIWLNKCITASDNDIYQIIDKYSEEHNKAPENKQLPINLDISGKEKLKEEIKFKLTQLYNYQENCKLAENNDKLQNYYFTSDLTPNLQERIGKTVEVDNKNNDNNSDDEGSSVWRKIKNIFLKDFKKYHAITNFLPFINEKGSIQQGELNEFHILNAIKTLLLTEGINQEDLRSIIEKGRINNIPLKCLLEVLNSTGNTLSANKYKSKETYIDMLFDVRPKIQNYYDKNKAWFETDEEFAYLGKFSNMSELAGVTYGTPQIYELKIVKLDDYNFNIDIPSYNFMKKYDEMYGLDENEAPLYQCLDIVNPNKPLAEKTDKIRVWDLAYKLFIGEKKRITNSRSPNIKS